MASFFLYLHKTDFDCQMEWLHDLPFSPSAAGGKLREGVGLSWEFGAKPSAMSHNDCSYVWWPMGEEEEEEEPQGYPWTSP
jgi:hypothetical protein